MKYFKKNWGESTGDELTDDWGISTFYFETDEFLNVLKYNFKDIVSVCSAESGAGGGIDLIIKIYTKDFNSDLYKKIKYFIQNHSAEFISYHFNICFKISDEFAIVTIEDIKYCI